MTEGKRWEKRKGGGKERRSPGIIIYTMSFVYFIYRETGRQTDKDRAGKGGNV